MGVSIASLEDMQDLFEGIPLDRVSTSMTINATASILLALYIAVGESRAWRRRGCPAPRRTTSSRSTSRAAPTSSRRAVDAAHHRHLRLLPPERARAGTRSRSPATTCARPGCTAVQEVAFTLANGIAYVEAALEAGLEVDDVRAAAVVLLQRAQQPPRGGGEVPRRAAAVGAHHAERFGAPRPALARCCASTRRRRAACSPRSSRRTTSCGWRCRRSRRCSAAASRCTRTRWTRRSALPTERAVRIALRTQQILAYESGVADTVDPLGGSYAVERSHARHRGGGGGLHAQDRRRWAARWPPSGFMQREIQDAAYRYQREVEDKAPHRGRRQRVRHRRRAARRSLPGSTRAWGRWRSAWSALRAKARPDAARGRSTRSSGRARARQPHAAHPRRGGGVGDARRDLRPPAGVFGVHQPSVTF